jgi:tRNA U34 2-thiouridine synthase MnmA/TrmU
MKSYRFLGEEAESLGTRLDAARKSLAGARSAWARNYWTQTVERLLFQWRQLPILHDGDAQVTIIPRWHVSYDFYEDAKGVAPGQSAVFYENEDVIGGGIITRYASMLPQ